MNKTSKYFLAFLVFAIAGVLYAGFVGRQQILQRKDDYIVYNEIQTSIAKEEGLQDSLEKLDELQKKYKDSYVFNIDKGFIYNSLDEQEKSQKEFETAFKKNNGLYKNVSLLLVYAETAHINGDDLHAKEAISQAQMIGIPEEYSNVVDKIISEIDKVKE
ncbi:hypothetical protein [Romboutsia timonensis]|uniref:hypothetical protein n=1 Tax=Romboutsia timonensis TaxID=1776391 RepID=UPI002A83435B|nr:hypothetical protein [Romboutsia timonensis]MDY3957996.1 hypothetical protein [Romboutsia timonensis]